MVATLKKLTQVEMQGKREMFVADVALSGNLDHIVYADFPKNRRFVRFFLAAAGHLYTVYVQTVTLNLDTGDYTVVATHHAIDSAESATIGVGAEISCSIINGQYSLNGTFYTFYTVVHIILDDVDTGAPQLLIEIEPVE